MAMLMTYELGPERLVNNCY